MSQLITKGLLSAKLIVKGFFGKIVGGDKPTNTIFIPCNIKTKIYIRCDI